MQTICSDDLITAKQLADRLGVKPGTILGWNRQGRIPAHRLSHKVVRFDLRAVLAALEGHRSAPERGGVA
jgi:excisionase family DNA binding protein